MPSSRSDQAVEIFRKAGGILRMSEAMHLGIHRRELYSLFDAGVLERLDRGVYRLTDMPDPSLPDLVFVSKRIPSGVICLVSALSLHEITTQVPHFVYLAVPRGAQRPSITHPPLRLYWYGDRLLEVGVETRQIDGFEIKVFNLEKTLVDCVKFRNKIGMDIVLEALRIAWQGGRLDMNKLFDYARMFRVEKILRPIMEAIASG